MIEHATHLILTATLQRPTTTTIPPYWARISTRYYDAKYEPFKRCVIKRESEGIPTVVNHSSGSAGLFQFMPGWRKILIHRLHLGSPWANKGVGIEKWPVKIQTASWWLILNHGRGAHNWAGGRYDCSHLLP